MTNLAVTAAAALFGAGMLLAQSPPPSAERSAADTATVRLEIRGMTCGSCAITARLALQRAEGVYRARVSYDSASAVVWYDSTSTSPSRLIAHLKKATGYEARVAAEAPRPGGTW